MIDPKVFEELAEKIGAFIASPPSADIQKNFRAHLSSFFDKLDLVSREEYDIQTRLLQRTIQKLDALEERVSLLESKDKA